jgi:signal transduction histidine kinase/ActR/RegA family two-component response regulator
MTWSEPSVIVLLSLSISMTIAFMILYYTNGRPKAVFAWLIAWASYIASFITAILGITFAEYEFFLIPAAQLCGLINSYTLLLGIYIYYKKRINRLWNLSFILCCVWIIIIQFVTPEKLIGSLPPSFFLFAAYFYSGILLIKGRPSFKPERIIAGILLMLWVVSRLYLTLCWITGSSLLTGIVIGSTLYILISLFTILTYLQETREQFIAEKYKAEESDRLKSSFLANMSHEIRTPLNAIIGFAQLLSKTDLSNEEKDIFVKNIKNSGERLLGLLDDLLDLSKIEAGVVKVYTGDVSINRLIEDLVSVVSLSQRVVEKKLNLVVEKAMHDGDDIIRTDETRIFQILSNLLNNAVKFTEHGTIITGYDIPGPDYIRFYVKDTGIGISEDALKKIYTPFFQEGKIPAAGGTGLGLAIVKGLTESLDGTITIKSKVDCGTEVSITIPYIRSEESKHIKSFTGSPESYNITGKKILLVEDEPVNRRLMEKFIESTGAELISTESGNESVELCLKDSSIDLVLMDLTLPDIDGYTAMERIRKVRPDLSIVAQSATAMSEHRERARDAGADDFIAKPIKREELYNAIWKQLFGREEN